MKRIFTVFLTLFLCYSLFGCGGTDKEEEKETEATTEATSEVDALEIAKTAYEGLNTISDATDLLMSEVYSAWGFSIYQGGDYTLDYTKGRLDFAKATGIDSMKIADAVPKALENTAYGALGENVYGQAFDDAACCVAIIQQVHTDDGLLDKIETLLSETKDYIKTVSAEDPEASYIDDLKNYYSEVQSYYDFAKSPTGNYKECSATMEEYKKNISNYKNNLSFDLE
jgi:hypothetical protein